MIIRKLTRRESDGGDGFDFMFRCPGCRCEHSFRLTGLSPRHSFNGDLLKPTIEPELIFDWGTGRCISNVRDGIISFDLDCSHRLAGQTLALEPIS